MGVGVEVCPEGGVEKSGTVEGRRGGAVGRIHGESSSTGTAHYEGYTADFQRRR